MLLIRRSISFLLISDHSHRYLNVNKVKTRGIIYLLSFWLLASSEVAYSQQDVEVFQITGSHFSKKELSTPIPAVSLTASEIEALSAISFADVLKGLPGVDINQQGGESGLTFLSIRGGDPNFVTILIDGVKVNDPTNSRGGAFDLGTIDPNMIEKVELYYGSYSSVFGSDALAGVISITTKTPKDGELGSISLRYGEGGTLGANINLGVPISSFANGNLSASFQNGDNSTFSDSFSRKQVIGSITSNGNTDSQWELGGFFAQGKGEYFPEDSGGDRLAIIRTPERRDYSQSNLSAKFKHSVTNKLDLTVTTAYSKRKESIINPGISDGVLDGVPPIESQTDYHNIDSLVKFTYPLSDYIHSTFGVAYTHEEGEMDSIIDFGILIDADYGLNRSTRSGFGEISISNQAWYNLLAGIRYDNSGNLSVSTHRIIGNVDLTDSLILHGQFSEGFKLPSFYALGHPLVGNKDLKPEQSQNVELGAHVLTLDKRLSTRLNFYQNKYLDLVDFDPVNFTNVNRSTIKVKGVELSSSYTPTQKWQLDAQVSFNDVNTYDDTVILRRRPEFKGSIRVTHHYSEPLNFTFRYRVNDDYFDSSVPTGFVKLNGRNQVDFSAQWETQSDTSWKIYINNIFDNDKEEVIGFHNIGRDINVSLTIKV
ncbi:TonB-dependent receptor plug domain-containing protein [Paraglaciecola marina]|uniref:TonB-dependent receptor plug domain-containing protein n=1 Tax=Paraglaciecola marina TaxID=2500157 RepID=UPI001414F2C4|nr:TonB-dependent receptor [Paraglaciecola marina]